jgi:Rrf2 family protein
MRLTAKSEYGLLAMIDIAGLCQDGPVSARGISERQVIPAKFLEQLLVSLRRAGLVSAVRGAHGGFTLTREPDAISVLDVVEALEGPLVSTVCESERGATCGRSGACAAARVWNRATGALRAVFAEATLAELLADQDRIDAGPADVVLEDSNE